MLLKCETLADEQFQHRFTESPGKIAQKVECTEQKEGEKGVLLPKKAIRCRENVGKCREKNCYLSSLQH